MNLALVGMQQDGAATAAGKIHRMLARLEHGRSLQDDADCLRGNYFKGNTSSHDALPISGGSATGRHRRLGSGPLPVMNESYT